MRTLCFGLLLLSLACGDDVVAGCPDGFEFAGGVCVPTSDAGIDAATGDGGSADGIVADAPACDAQTTFYRDEDGDTFGDPDISEMGCVPPEGFVADNSDCNDSEATAAPGMTEVCDALDNDCDYRVDEGLLEVGEESRIGFGSADVDLRMEAYSVGYVVAVTEIGERKLVSIGQFGGLSLAEWVLGDTESETVAVHILDDERRAIVLEVDVANEVQGRVVALDGTTVSAPATIPLAGTGGDHRIVEAAGRVFLSFVTGGSEPFVRHAVELDGDTGAPVGEPVAVYNFTDPGPIVTGFANLIPDPAGGGFIAVALDRAEGDLVAQPYLIPVSVEPALEAGPAVRVAVDSATVLAALVSGDEGEAIGVYASSEAEISHVSLDASLTETTRRALTFSGEMRGLIRPRGRSQSWLLAIDSNAGMDNWELYIPASPLAEGQQLLLTDEPEDFSQRTPNDGAYVYKNADDQYMFRRITCTPAE